eukprot:3271621-Pleurochrysis_carterae.AAC.1
MVRHAAGSDLEAEKCTKVEGSAILARLKKHTNRGGASLVMAWRTSCSERDEATILLVHAAIFSIAPEHGLRPVDGGGIEFSQPKGFSQGSIMIVGGGGEGNTAADMLKKSAAASPIYKSVAGPRLYERAG